MGILVTADDFTGKYKLSQSLYGKAQLDAYIDKYEKELLTQLMGKTLFDLFVADLVAKVPQTARFIAIYNEFDIDEPSCLIHSDGMKEMVKAYVYFFYTRESPVINTSHGNVVNNQENADRAKGEESAMVLRYNEAIDTYRAIQWYIEDSSATYPEENMQFKNYTSGI